MICYQCEKECDYLLPDSRCGECTRYTPEELIGELEEEEDETQ